MIDDKGVLYIQRKHKSKRQKCPKQNKECGDECPKFGEPYQSYIIDDKGNRIEGVVLRLCEQDQLFFTEFSDYR